MNTNAPLIKAKDLMLIERMGVLRLEIDALDINEFIGLNRVVVGKIKQQFGSAMLWFQQWANNRTYTAATNASMALGKLSSLMDMVPCVVEKTGETVALFDAVHDVFTECWESIENGGGRIVPME